MKFTLLASLFAVALAHETSICTPEAGCIGAEPSWVEKFAQPLANGPEQFWINLGATPDIMVVGWFVVMVFALHHRVRLTAIPAGNPLLASLFALIPSPAGSPLI